MKKGLSETDEENDFRSLVLWRNIQGYLVLTCAISPVILFFGLNQNLYLMIWASLIVMMIGAGFTRRYYRERVLGE